MKKKLLIGVALVAGVLFAQQAVRLVDGPGTSVTENQSAVVTVGSATTLKIVTGAATQQIRITAFLLTQPTSGTGISFTSGTGTNCGTGAAVLTGVFDVTVKTPYSAGNGSSAIIQAPVGTDVCVTAAGAGANGFISYRLD